MGAGTKHVPWSSSLSFLAVFKSAKINANAALFQIVRSTTAIAKHGDGVVKDSWLKCNYL